MGSDIRLGLQVRDYGRKVSGILYRDVEEEDRQEIYNFEEGKWQSYDIWEIVEGDPEAERQFAITLNVEALRRAAMTMYQNGLLRDAPPGYVPVSQHEDLRRRLEEAKQAHLDDVRLLIKTKE